MNIIEVLSQRHAIPLILAVGDKPGQVVRALITDDKNHPSRTLFIRLQELQEAGLVMRAADVVRGTPVSRVNLTAKGEDVYRLLCVIRGMS